MDPLDKRYNDSLEPQRQPQHEGGELDWGDSAELRPWHEGGLASDSDRSLLQVQRQEAWLQDRQGASLLDAGDAVSHPGLPGTGAIRPASGLSSELLVIDTSRSDWQQQVGQRASDTDLLLLEPEDQGLERIQSALEHHSYGRITLLPGSDGNGTRSLGADRLDTSALATEQRSRLEASFRSAGNAELHVVAGEIPPGLQRALADSTQLTLVEQPPSTNSVHAIATQVGDSAEELLSLGRELLHQAEQSGRLQQAIEAAFSAANQGAVLAAAIALIKAEQAPQVQWSRFQLSSIRGAFLQDRNTILISEQLRPGGAALEAVVLEELGHWLEATACADSGGDEGERFSAALRDERLEVEIGRDTASLLIDGSVVQAELAQIVSDDQQQALLSDNRTAITLTFDEPLTNPTSVGMARFSFSNASGTALANFPAISSFSIANNKLTINLVSPVDTSTLTNGLKVNYSGEPSMGGTALAGSNNIPVGTFSAFVSFTSSGSSAPSFNSMGSYNASTKILLLQTLSGSGGLDLSEASNAAAREAIRGRFSVASSSNGAAIANAISSVALSGNAVSLSLNDSVLSAYNNQPLFIRYSDSAAIEDTTGVLQSSTTTNGIKADVASFMATFAFSTSTTTSGGSTGTAPTFTSSGITYDASTSRLFINPASGSLDTSGAGLDGLQSKFAIYASNPTAVPAPQALSSAITSLGVTASQVTLNLDANALSTAGISPGQTLFVVYIDPSMGDDSSGVLQGTNGADVGPFSFSFQYGSGSGASGSPPSFSTPTLDTSTGLLRLNRASGTLDLTDSGTAALAGLFSISTAAGGAAPIAGAILSNGVGLTSDGITISLNHSILSSYSGQTLYVSYNDPNTLANDSAGTGVLQAAGGGGTDAYSFSQSFSYTAFSSTNQQPSINESSNSYSYAVRPGTSSIFTANGALNYSDPDGGTTVVNASLSAIKLSTKIPLATPWRTAGEYANRRAFAIICSDGSVQTWGDPDSGGDSSAIASQLSSGVQEIFSSTYAFAALKTDGSVVTWGDSWHGGDSSSVSSQLSSGIKRIFSTGEGAFAAIKTNGTVVTWGDTSFGANSQSVSSLLTGVVDIASTQGAFAALRDDGSVVTWGPSSYGGESTSVGSTLSSGVVKLLGTDEGGFAALKSDGSVVTWGDAAAGGSSTTVVSQLSSGVASLFCTTKAFAALKTDGSVVTWGSSGHGGDSSSVRANINAGVTHLVANHRAFAALKSDGSVVSWGDDGHGGNSSTLGQTLGAGVVSITASSSGAFAALKDDGSVVTWGHSTQGGDSTAVASLLRPNNTSSTPNNPITKITATTGAFAALRSDGSVVVWGDADFGGSPSQSIQSQLSSGIRELHATTRAFSAIKHDGNVISWGDSAYGGTLNTQPSGVAGFASIQTLESSYAATSETLSNALNTALTATLSAAAGNSGGGSANWSFQLNESQIGELEANQRLTATYRISLGNGSTQGSTSENVVVVLTGSNDRPIITAVDVSGSITETSTVSDSGSLTFVDLDRSDRPTAAKATKSVTARRADGTTAFSLTSAQRQKLEDAFAISIASGATNNGTVNWTYNIQETDLNFLAAGETVNAVFTVTVTDNAGATSSTDVTVLLTGTNDAPTTLVSSVPLPALAEDDTAESTVAQLFNSTGSNAAFADLDNSGMGDAFAGVVLIANAATTAQGNWQYKAPTGVWTNVSSTGSPLGLTSALFLPYDYSLRFQPATNWNGNAGSLTARLADGPLSAHSSGGLRLNLSSGGSGGTTRYSDSSNAVTLTATVSAVNDAPVVSLAAATLAAITEDNTDPTGASVSSFVAASFSDATDAITGGSSANTFAGIAITAYSADASKGQWQYSSNSGSTWSLINAVAGASTAFTLKASDWIRFLPAQDFNGSAPSLDVVLIDSSTTVTTAAVIDASSRGGTSAFSTGTVVISHSVSAVNDAPTLNPPATFNLLEDTTGNLVFNANTFADVDAGSGSLRATLSIADGYLQIASANLGGVSLDSTSTPTNRIFTGTVASLNNFFSTAGNIKYTPAINNDTQRTLTLTVSDQGNTGSGLALTASATSTILVQAVSDDPTITSTNVIKIDLSNAGNSDGGSLSDWNTLNNGGTSSSVKRHADGNTISGVSISVNGSSADNTTDSANWPGADSDPYYIKATDDRVVSTSGGLGLSGKSNELNITTSGLDTARLYTVRVYSLINETLANIDVGVTNGATTTWNRNLNRQTLFNSVPLSESLIFRNVAPDSTGKIIVSIGSTQAVSAEAVVIEPVAAEVIGLPETNAGLSRSGSFRINDPDRADTVKATRTLAVSGSSNRSDPAAPSDADLLAMFAISPVDPAAVLDNTEVTDILTWSFNSGSEAFNYLRKGETLVLAYTVTATDNNATPLSDSETVTLTITGTNDTPLITGGADTAALLETDTTLTTNGSITVTDVDTTDIVTAAVSSVALSGTFTLSGSTLPANLSASNYQALKNMLALTPAAGPAMAANNATGGTSFDWTFTSGSAGDVAFDFLKKNETLTLTYTLTLSDNSDASGSDAAAATTTTVAVTLTGTNDGPIVTAAVDVLGAAAERSEGTPGTGLSNTVLTDAGSFLIGDRDLADVQSVSVTPPAGARGILSAQVANNTTGDGAGQIDWLYLVNDAALNNLAHGQTLNEVFTVTISDGNGGSVNQLVTVTLTGTNDKPLLTATPATLPAGNELQPYNFTIQQLLQGYTDPDSTDTLSIDPATVSAVGGAISFNATTGTFTYSRDSSNSVNLGSLTEDTPRTFSIAELLGGSLSAINVPVNYAVRDSTGTTTAATNAFTLQRAATAGGAIAAGLALREGYTDAGSFSQASGGSWTFTPALNFNGPVQFTYTIDVGSGPVPYNGAFSIAAVNDAPILTPSTGNGAEDANSTAFMVGADPEGSAIAVLRVRDTASLNGWIDVNQDREADGSSLTNGYGTLRVRPFGTFNFIADGPLSQALPAGQQAQVSFTYEATDGLLVSSSTVTFTLTGSNDIPTVVADIVTIQEDAVLIREASQGVLANDVDVDTPASQLRIFRAGLPGQAAMEMNSNGYIILTNTYGTLLMRSNGAYSFVADGQASQALAPRQTATTSFVYQAWDGVSMNDYGSALPSANPLWATNTLNITITGTNDAPLINGELNLGSIQEDGTFTITAAQLLASATDIDSPSSSLLVASLAVDPRQGQITPVAGSSNSWTFTPTADWNGTAELRYVISDGTDRSSQSNFSNGVQLKGDRLFLLTTGGSWANAEQQAIALGGRLTSIESSAQQASLEEMFSFRLDQPLWIGFNDAGQEGTWTWNDGSAITFTRWAGFSPWGSMTPFNPNQTWGGGGDTDYAVLMADQASGSYPRRDWGVRPGDGLFSNLMGIAEIPYLRRGDSAYAIVQGPTWEQAEANAVKLGGHLVTINDAAENEWLISNGLVGSGKWFGFSDQNSEGDWRWSDSSLTSYTNWSSGSPDNSRASNVSEGQDFGVIGSSGYWDDGENPLWPGIAPLNGIAEINISGLARLGVSPVDDAPRLGPDQASALQDQPLSISAAAGLLANDRDPEAAPLQVVQISSLGNSPQQVSLVDGNAVLTNSYGTLAVGSNGAYTFLANGPDSQRLAAGQTAQTSFSYAASDGNLQSSSTLTITVTGVNDAPVPQADLATVIEDGTVSATALTGVLANDQDPDVGNQLRVVGLRNLADSRSVPSSGTTSLSDSYGTLNLAADGSYSFSANGAASQSLAVGQSAQTSFTVTVSDGMLSRESTLSFTITGSNDAPRVVGPLSNLTNGVEGAPYPIQASALLAGITDPDQGDALRIRNLIASGGTLAASGDNLWILTVQASTQVNLGSGQEDTPLSFSVDQLLGGSRSTIDVRLSYDVDDDQGGSLPVQRSVSMDRTVNLAGADITQLEVLNGGGVASRQSDGSWLIQPTGNRNGLLEIAYTVQAGASSTVYTASCILEAVNDPPARSSGPLPPVQLQEDAASTGLGLDNLSYTQGGGADESNQTLTYRIHGLPVSALGAVTKADGTAVSAGQVLSLAELRLLRFTPAANASGNGELKLEIRDSAGSSLIDTLAIAVSPVNDPAVIGGISNLQVVEDTAVQVINGVTTLRRTGQFSISDVDGQAEAAFQTNVSPINGPLGQLQLSSNGSYTYSLDNSLEAVQALRQGEQRVDTFEIRSVDGSSSQVSFTIQGSADNTRARLIDGYIAGAKVFVDLNNDGQLNWTDSNTNSRWDVGEGEAWVATDSQGALDFDFGSPSGRLRSLGGTDTSTGLAFTGSLSAPAGSGVITPLTSLILQMADGLSGGTPQSRLQAAENSVRQALGIAPSQPLNQLDPIAALSNPLLTPAERQQALAVQQRASQIANLITISEATGQGGRTLIQALVAAVQGSGNTPLSLSSVSTVSSLLNASRPNGTPPVQSSVINNLATANALINQATNLQTVVSSQQMAQGELASSLAQLNSSGGAGWLGVRRATLAENATAGTAVAQLQYQPSSSSSAGAVSYRLSDGTTTSNLPFSIDNDGTVRVATAVPASLLNFEANATVFNLTVEALSNGTALASTTLSISLADINEAPLSLPDALAIDLQQTLESGIPATYGLLINDSDPDAGSVLQVDLSGGSTLTNAYGRLLIAADGSYRFIADGAASRALAAGALATTSFSYTLSDGSLSSVNTLTISITGRNDAPIPPSSNQLPALSGLEGSTTTITAAQLLQGFSDPDTGDTLAVINLIPSLGSLQQTSTGNWSYSTGSSTSTNLGRTVENTPKLLSVADLLGGDLSSIRVRLDYQVVDGQQVGLSTSRELVLQRSTPLTSSSISAVSLVGSSASHASISQQTDGSYRLTPNSGYEGPLEISYQVSSNPGGTRTLTAVLTVIPNQPPVPLVPPASTTLVLNEDDPLTDLGLANVEYGPGGGSDEASQTLTYRITQVPDVRLGQMLRPSGGDWLPVRVDDRLTLAQLRSLSFEGNPFSYGSGQLGYEVTDSAGGSLAQQLAITVNPVNNPPERIGELPSLLQFVEDSGSNALGLSGLTYLSGTPLNQPSSVLAIRQLSPTEQMVGVLHVASGAFMALASYSSDLLSPPLLLNASGGPTLVLQRPGSQGQTNLELINLNAAGTATPANRSQISFNGGSGLELLATQGSSALVGFNRSTNRFELVDLTQRTLRPLPGSGSSGGPISSQIQLNSAGTQAAWIAPNSPANTTVVRLRDLFSGSERNLSIGLPGIERISFGATGNELYAVWKDNPNSTLYSIGSINSTDGSYRVLTRFSGAQSSDEALSTRIDGFSINADGVAFIGLEGTIDGITDEWLTGIDLQTGSNLGTVKQPAWLLQGMAPLHVEAELNSALQVRITSLPDAALGVVRLASGTPVAIGSNTLYSLSELQGMRFEPAANAVGISSSTFSYEVIDPGIAGSSNSTQRLYESIQLQVLASNEAPQSIGRVTGPSLIIDNSQLILDPTTERYQPIAVGLADLIASSLVSIPSTSPSTTTSTTPAAIAYAAGLSPDELANQSLRWRISAFPRSINTLINGQTTTQQTTASSTALLDVDFEAGDRISASVNGQTYVYTVSAADLSSNNPVAIRTALASAVVAGINADTRFSGLITATADAGRITLASQTASTSFLLQTNSKLGDLQVQRATATNGSYETLNPAALSNPSLQGSLNLSLNELKTLRFIPVTGIDSLNADGRLGQLTFEVIDAGTGSSDADLASSGGVKVLTQTLQILVDTNKASARASQRLTSTTSDAQAIAAALSVNPTNPDPGLSGNADGAIKALSTSVNSQLSTDHPLYLASIGGEGLLNGAPINYAPSAVPILFDIPLSGAQAVAGAQVSKTLVYSPKLDGAFRSTGTGQFTAISNDQGFSLSKEGSWSFDPEVAYATVAVGAPPVSRSVTVVGPAATAGHGGTYVLDFSISRVAVGTDINPDTQQPYSTLVVEVAGSGSGFTTMNRGKWISSSTEGKTNDRYFKFISEYTLAEYGATATQIGVDPLNNNQAIYKTDADGNKLFTWPGAPALVALDGKPITTAGYYDFTRVGGATGSGDGAVYTYATVTENNQEVDYIVGVTLHLTNNRFGDNDPNLANIRDPGAPVTVMRELGVVTTVNTTTTNVETSTTVNTTTVVVPAEFKDERTEDPFDSQLSANTFRPRTLGVGDGQPGGRGVLNEQGAGTGTINAMSMTGQANLASRESRSGTGNGQTALTLQGQGEGEGNRGGDSNKPGATAASARAQARDGDGDADSNQLRQRGLKLDPIQALAAAATGESTNLLEQLSETNLLGTNLLDALALGAGVLYLLYGPKAMAAGQQGWRRWLGRRGGDERNTAAAGERDVMAIVLMRRENGSQQILAAKVGQGSMTLLAEQDLPNLQDPRVINDAIQHLLGQLNANSNHDVILMDSRLQAAALENSERLARLGKQQLNFSSERLEIAIASCSESDLQALRYWLNKPSSTPPDHLEVMQLLNQRRVSFEETLPPDQARMASMIELSLALTWSQGPS